MGENQKPSDSDGVVNNAHRNNSHGKKLLIFAMVFVNVFFIYITFFHPHSSPDHIKEVKAVMAADTTPPAAAQPAAAPAAGGGDPWVETPEKLTKGETLYKTNCALCHGDKGMGDGPAGQALKPPPRNFTEDKFKFGNSTIAIFNTITNGSPGTSMAAYKDILPEADRWAIALHLKKIGKNIVDPTEADIKSFKEKK